MGTTFEQAGAPGPFGPVRPTITRRSVLKGAALGALALGTLSACGSSGVTKLRFFQSKPEVIGYFDTHVVAPFNKSHPDIQVTHDSTTNLVASMVRGNPHDLVLNNYDQTAGIFVSRGVLQNLGNLPEAKKIDPNVQKLVSQYATGGSATDVSSVLGDGRGNDLQQGPLRQVRPEGADHLGRAHRRVQGVQGEGCHAVLRDLPRHLDHSAGLVRLRQRRHDRRRRLLRQASAGGRRRTDELVHERLCPAVDKMVELVQYFNSDAGSKAYPDGNAAFAAGAAAMYMQGPWAIGEVAVANPKLPVGTFPLPVTNNKSDLKVAGQPRPRGMDPRRCGSSRPGEGPAGIPVRPADLVHVQPGQPGLHADPEPAEGQGPAHRRAPALRQLRRVLPGSGNLRAAHHPARQLPPGTGAHKGRQGLPEPPGQRLAPSRKTTERLRTTERLTGIDT